MDPTWIVRLDAPGDGPRLAVKDCIDVAGLPTTVGCQLVAERARPAAADAPVVAAARRAGARIAGKTNLSELCWSASGTNSWSGTPVNPLDAVELGMRLIEPGFAAAPGPPDTHVGRLRPDADPVTDAAVDTALAAAGLHVADAGGFDFRAANQAGNVIIDAGAYPVNAYLLEHADRMSPQLRRNLAEAAALTDDELAGANRVRQAVRNWFAAALDRHGFLALPTLTGAPPRPGERGMPLTILTMPANLAGLPALALPVPGGPAGLPASLQLIGPPHSEERLIALGRAVEAALRTPYHGPKGGSGR